MRVPIDLVFSCRQDDILMLQEITQWCRDALENDVGRRDAIPFKGIRQCTLLLTEFSGAGSRTPFATEGTSFDSDRAEDLENFSKLANTRLVRGRVNSDLLREEVSKMPDVCRIVVSGPAAFNTAVRTTLLSSDVREEQVTILTA
eukprot:3553681-Amphidinium_carterae.1